MGFGDSIPLPKDWPAHVRGAMVQAVGLAHKALVHVQGWAVDSSLARVRLKAEKERLQNEVALLKRELELVKSRIERMPANKRFHYLPTERLAILELKAARRWNAAETARRMLVSPATIASWLDRLNRDGDDGLVRTPEPVNRFPQMVDHVVQSLRATLPSMGKKRIADTLARAGLHLGVTTVARMLKRAPKKKPPGRPEPTSGKTTGEEKSSVGDAKRTVKAAYPHHVWNLDFSAPCTVFANRQIEAAPIKGGLMRKGTVKPDRVPTVGLNQQSGLNCTGRSAIRCGPGYHRVHGETTKHATEASAFNVQLPMAGWGGESCGPNRLGLKFRAGGHEQFASGDGAPPVTIVPCHQG